jgi:RNA polymerase sigma-70 factor (ECF subfamily)
MSITDAELIADSLTQPAAFQEIFQRHFDCVYRYCARRIGTQAGEDAAGEVLCRAFEHRSQYDRARPDARPWLLGIAANVVAGHLRSSGRQAAAYQRAASYLLAGALVDDHAGVGVDARQELRVVAKALASMPTVEVETLLLYVWDELSYADIAIALDVPVGTVRSRLSRVRQRLRDELHSNAPGVTASSDKDGRFGD